MTVVSIRCHECDEVKPEEEVDIGAKGNICHDCKTDVPDELEDGEDSESANSDETEVSKEEVAKTDGESEDSADSPNESEEVEDSDENAEEDKKPLEESFSEQDPLEW